MEILVYFVTIPLSHLSVVLCSLGRNSYLITCVVVHNVKVQMNSMFVVEE